MDGDNGARQPALIAAGLSERVVQVLSHVVFTNVIAAYGHELLAQALSNAFKWGWLISWLYQTLNFLGNTYLTS